MKRFARLLTAAACGVVVFIGLTDAAAAKGHHGPVPVVAALAVAVVVYGFAAIRAAIKRWRANRAEKRREAERAKSRKGRRRVPAGR